MTTLADQVRDLEERDRAERATLDAALARLPEHEDIADHPLLVVAARAIERLTGENESLRAERESAAANAIAVVMADAGYTEEDRRVLAAEAGTFIGSRPVSPLLNAVRAAVQNEYGNAASRAAWLRSRGWLQPSKNSVSFSWCRPETPAALFAFPVAMKQQLEADLRGFKWLLT